MKKYIPIYFISIVVIILLNRTLTINTYMPWEGSRHVSDVILLALLFYVMIVLLSVGRRVGLISILISILLLKIATIGGLYLFDISKYIIFINLFTISLLISVAMRVLFKVKNKFKIMIFIISFFIALFIWNQNQGNQIFEIQNLLGLMIITTLYIMLLNFENLKMKKLGIMLFSTSVILQCAYNVLIMSNIIDVNGYVLLNVVIGVLMITTLFFSILLRK